MSNLNGTSYTQIIDRLEAFANGHQMINSFMHGLIDLIDVPKDQRYPAMHVEPGEIQPVQGGLNYQFSIVFYDLPRAKEVENEYQRECISDMARLALDLIAEIKNGNVLFSRDVTLATDPVIGPFIEGYSQVTTGVLLTISLNVPYNWNACDIPADYSVGGSGSGGSGSGASSIVLKVNGTNNAVQNVLNLVNGSNITITDLGDGRVRIAATGGGGGGVDWGAIGGDITDQADLIALIGGYATGAELTAEATTRANADTALQGDIDQVAADLVTETTARMAGDATNATDISNVNNALTAHTGNTSNPHNTTKAQVGLGNVPNVDATSTANITDSANKRFVTDAQLVVIGNTSNTNTGDETTASIQTKRPIKTVNGQSLEGAGNVVVAATQAFRVTGAALSLVGSSGDRFVPLQSAANLGAEASANMSAEFAMTITEIRVRTTSTTQPASGSLVFTLRRNGADTALVLTIAPSSVAGVFTATGSIAIAVGDLICLKARNNATATSATVNQISVSYT